MSVSEDSRFFVVEFKGTNSLAVVPYTWVDELDATSVFPSNQKEASKLAKKITQPIETWESYEIDIIFRCSSYEAALKKMKRVENEESGSTGKERGRGQRRKRQAKNFGASSDDSTDETGSSSGEQSTPKMPIFRRNTNGKETSKSNVKRAKTPKVLYPDEDSELEVRNKIKKPENHTPKPVDIMNTSQDFEEEIVEPERSKEQCAMSKNKEQHAASFSKDEENQDDRALENHAKSFNKEQKKAKLTNGNYSQGMNTKDFVVPDGMMLIKEDWYRSVNRNLEIIKINGNDMMSLMEAMMKRMDANGAKTTLPTSPVVEFDFSFPIQSLEDLKNLETKLESIESKAQFLQYLKNIGGSNVKSFVKRIFLQILTDEVLVLFNWEGRKTKQMFKNFIMTSQIIEAVMASDAFQCTKKDVEDEMKSRLRHAKGNLDKKKA